MIEESNLFIVDRNTSSRKALARLIRAAGFNVQSFEFLKEFFDEVVKDSSGCLLLDLDLVEMPIEEMKTILEQHYTNLLVFVISSDDKQEIKEKAIKINAKEYFRKPVDGKALIDSINWALKTKSHNQNASNI